MGGDDPFRHLLARHGVAEPGPDSKRPVPDRGTPLPCYDAAVAALGAIASAAAAAEAMLLRRRNRMTSSDGNQAGRQGPTPREQMPLKQIPIEFY